MEDVRRTGPARLASDSTTASHMYSPTPVGGRGGVQTVGGPEVAGGDTLNYGGGRQLASLPYKVGHPDSPTNRARRGLRRFHRPVRHLAGAPLAGAPATPRRPPEGWWIYIYVGGYINDGGCVRMGPGYIYVGGYINDGGCVRMGPGIYSGPPHPNHHPNPLLRQQGRRPPRAAPAPPSPSPTSHRAPSPSPSPSGVPVHGAPPTGQSWSPGVLEPRAPSPSPSRGPGPWSPANWPVLESWSPEPRAPRGVPAHGAPPTGQCSSPEPRAPRRPLTARGQLWTLSRPPARPPKPSPPTGGPLPPGR